MKEKLIEIRDKARQRWEQLPWERLAFLKAFGKRLAFLKKYNPLKYIQLMDWYIIKKFIGTYIYSILLIISISIVFDVNENLAKFTTYHAPLRAIVFDYYMNFVCLYLSPSSSSRQNWQAILRLLPCLHVA